MKRTHLIALLVAIAVVAATAVTILLVTRNRGPAVVVTVTASPNEPGSDPTPQPSETSPVPSTTEPVQGGDCPETQSGPFDGLTEAPETVWEIVRTTALPTSPAGPKIIDGEVRRCYDHSAEGALLAAANITALVDVDAVVEGQITAGPARDSLLEYNKENPGPRQFPVQFAGFSLTTAASDQVQVQLVLRNTMNGGLGLATILMVWSEGDWKVNGEVTPPPTVEISSMAGFVPWAGVS